VPTETAASLNRSYETGRRTRSAAAAARRSRIRTANSTSSVPTTTTHVADDDSAQRMTVQGDSQASNTLGLLTSLNFKADHRQVKKKQASQSTEFYPHALWGRDFDVDSIKKIRTAILKIKFQGQGI